MNIRRYFLILVILLFSSCSSMLIIKPERISSLTPTFSFYRCETCMEKRKIKLAYLNVYYKADDGSDVTVWTIKTKNNLHELNEINKIVYGQLPAGYQNIVEAKPLDWGIKYSISGIMKDVQDESVLGGSGSFVLIQNK